MLEQISGLRPTRDSHTRPARAIDGQHLGCFVAKGASNLIFICRGVGMADKLASDTSEEIHAGSSPVPCTRKKHICNSDVLFSTKSADGGRNLPMVVEIALR